MLHIVYLSGFFRNFRPSRMVLKGAKSHLQAFNTSLALSTRDLVSRRSSLNIISNRAFLLDASLFLATFFPKKICYPMVAVSRRESTIPGD